MSLNDTMHSMEQLLTKLMHDLHKAAKGNKAASQRVRTGSIKFQKVAKHFRKESVHAEKTGGFKKKKATKAKAAKKPARKVAKKKVHAKAVRKPARRKPARHR